MGLHRFGVSGEGPDAEAADIIRETARSLCTSAQQSRLVVRGGEGCTLRTAQGWESLDLIAGYGVVSTGWNHPRLGGGAAAGGAGCEAGPRIRYPGSSLGHG
jgi:4-aminobutyrate aminotransferase-like enzyme